MFLHHFKHQYIVNFVLKNQNVIEAVIICDNSLSLYYFLNTMLSQLTFKSNVICCKHVF